MATGGVPNYTSLPIHEPRPTRVTITFAEPVTKVSEVIRGVSLPVRKDLAGSSVTFTIQPGRPYALQVRPR